MGIKTRIVETEEEIYICDLCNKETTDYDDQEQCYICNRSVCYKCYRTVYLCWNVGYSADTYKICLSCKPSIQHIIDKVALMKTEYESAIKQQRDLLISLRKKVI